MSHFYGTLDGSKGQATRCGTKSSGLLATANGWSIGGSVKLHYDPILGTDVVLLFTTRGSGTSGHFVASFAIIDDKLTVLNTGYPEIFI